ncbi:MAG: S8/S53 family peptidase [Actinomycetota bacterium]
MPFDEENAGDPFRGDFPDRSAGEPRAELEPAIQRQITELAQRGRQPNVRHDLLRLLSQRRQGPGAAPIPLAFLPAPDRFDTLVVPGELLITAESYERRANPARPILDNLGITASPAGAGELEGRVLRLSHPHMGEEALAGVASDLRSQGYAVSLSNITPTAPVAKAIGGPRPTTGPGPFSGDGCPGTPARVAIIDTGITPERRSDNWLAQIPRGNDTDPLDAFPYPAGDGFLDLDAGHGTFVAGIIQQVAPDADIRIYRAIDSDGVGSEVDVACAMVRAVRDGAQIVNLSMGCQTIDDYPPIAIRAALDIIGDIEHEENRQVLVVAAAGNFADSRPSWPAAFREVVSVAALTPELRPANWSTRGFWVTCSTIGQGVRSTYVPGREAPLVNPDPFDYGADAWAAWSGTSFTAPQISGAVARLHDEQVPPRAALRRLLRAGQPIPEFGQALRVLPGM